MRNLSFAAACALAGCALQGADTGGVDLGETVQDVTSSNGIGLNGIGLNGIGLNGIGLNGIGLNGIGLNGIGLNGIGLNGIGLNGTQLDGAQIVGSTWTGELSDGGSLELRIDDMSHGSGLASDVGMYAFSYNTSDGWKPLCGVDGNGVAIKALAVPGVWNLSSGAYAASNEQFTLACRGKSIAKCVEMGYKQWTHAGHMQACTRLLRGDYCGTGTPNTIDGQTVDIYDDIGVQAMVYTNWDPEGEWYEGGAKCISQVGRQRFSSLGLPTPPCITDKTVRTTATCGNQLWQAPALLKNRLPPIGGTTNKLASTSLAK